MKHLELEKLLNKFEGLLPSAEEREVAAHLSVCPDCAALDKRLAAFFSYANADKSEQVSQAVTARLLNIFQPRKTPAPKVVSFGKRILAALAFDDWQTALNERFASTDSRHLLYRGEQFEVDLRLQFIGEKCQVSGQLLPGCADGATAEIFSAETSEKVFLNEHCEFIFPSVKEGIYNLRITAGEINVEIENLSLAIK